MAHPLGPSFFQRPTLRVAKDLLGKTLVRRPSRKKVQRAQIVDVEAYIGQEDRACHAGRGRTPRTEVMFWPGGAIYVYLIYGLHHCLNLVTEREDFPAAVLIRGIETPQGRIDGPGRVCRFLDIDRSLNRGDATVGRSLWVEEQIGPSSQGPIEALARVGVDYAGPWAQKLWRFRLPWA